MNKVGCHRLNEPNSVRGTTIFSHTNQLLNFISRGIFWVIRGKIPLNAILGDGGGEDKFPLREFE